MALGKRFAFQVLLLYVTYSAALEPQEVEPECFLVDWVGHVRQQRGVLLLQICHSLLCVASSLKLSNSQRLAARLEVV